MALILYSLLALFTVNLCAGELAPTLTLRNGVKQPVLGLGTRATGADLAKIVPIALDTGYRYFDTAQKYANEDILGKALADYFATGKLKRDDVFVSTKIWAINNAPENVASSLAESLKKLQLEHVDMLLLHMPAAFKGDTNTPDLTTKLEDSWKALEAAYNKKLTRSIGLSNVNAAQIQRILAIATEKPHNVQNECHVYLNQTEIAELAKQNGITFTAYAPLGSPGSALEWAIVKQLPDTAGLLEPLKNELVVQLATKYSKTPAQILIRYLIQRGMVTVPKTVHEDRVKSNFQVFDFKLTDEEVNQLIGVKGRMRVFKQEFMIGHPEDPFKDERANGH